jgi:hypothetical protein
MGTSAEMFDSHAVLIYPPFISYFAGPPLGIASLSAALRNRGYRCEAWDVNAEFIYHLARRPALMADLSSRLEQRLLSLYRLPALDYYAQQEARAVIHTLDRVAPIVWHLLASGVLAEDEKIVGDHDKGLALILLMQMAALNTFSSRQSHFLECSNAEMSPTEAVRLACEESFGVWGEFARRSILPRILDAKPRLVGFSLMDVTQLLPTLFLAHLVKTAMPQVFIAVGGSYVSAIKDKVALLTACGPLIDLFSCFEGETALTLLIDRLANGFQPGSDLPNFAPWNGRTYQWHEQSFVEDLEQLPIPDFDAMDLDIYFRPRGSSPIPLITSKGCVYGKCAYCTYTFQEPVTREQSIHKVLTGLRTLQQRYGVQTFSLKDSLITTRRARALAESFRNAGLDITWNFQSKISAGFTPDLIELLAQTGCRTVEFGVETPNPRLQKMIQKPAALEMIDTVLNNFAGSEITVIFNMIYGFPTESKEEAEQSLEWVSAISKRHPNLRFASVNHMLNMSRNSMFYTASERYSIDRIGEWPFSAKAEWVTPPWHNAFGHKIAKVLHRSDAETTKLVFTILAQNRHHRKAKGSSLPVIEASLKEAEEQIERIRIDSRLLRAQAAQEYARLTPPLRTELLQTAKDPCQT